MRWWGSNETSDAATLVGSEQVATGASMATDRGVFQPAKGSPPILRQTQRVSVPTSRYSKHMGTSVRLLIFILLLLGCSFAHENRCEDCRLAQTYDDCVAIGGTLGEGGAGRHCECDVQDWANKPVQALECEF